METVSDLQSVFSLRFERSTLKELKTYLLSEQYTGLPANTRIEIYTGCGAKMLPLLYSVMHPTKNVFFNQKRILLCLNKISQVNGERQRKI